MINITFNQVRLLKSLSLGERFPLSNLKGKIFQQLLDEHVLSKFPQGNGFIIYAHSPIALLNHLSNKYIKCSLDDYIEKMEINELRKVDNILMRGNSKSNETHPMNGFLVKSIYNPQNEMFRLLGTKRSFSQNETFFFSHPYPPTLPFST